MLTSHPYVETPHADTKVWRYLDLERLIALLHTKSLHMCRLDSFRDPWEGTWPQSVVDAVRSNWEGKGGGFLEMSKNLRCANYVSCWHESDTESAALWDLYSGKSGVAIQSTVWRLQNAIKDERAFHLGRVRYVDFEREPLPTLNLLVPAFLKRKSFEHEKEVRVLFWKVPEDMRFEAAAPVEALSLDSNMLIQSLYVAPSSPAWLVEPLQALCRQYGVAAPVHRSSLYDPRVY
jgi:hypothetical protein